MYVLFEEDGAFKTGHILSEADAALQVESSSGKRSKIKRSNCLYTFANPAPEALLTQAEALSQDIDLQFLWECAPQEEFDVEGLGADYFGHAPSALEKTTLLLRLHSAPVYFHRRGRGRYKPALTQEWSDQMVAGALPAEVSELAVNLITRPDKNSQAWKALDAACAATRQTPERLLLSLGAWPHALALHKGRFLATHFPRGTHIDIRCDNTSAIAGAHKGSSKVLAMHVEIRRLVAELKLLGVTVDIAYVSSLLNWADGPSRGDMSVTTIAETMRRGDGTSGGAEVSRTAEARSRIPLRKSCRALS